MIDIMKNYKFKINLIDIDSDLGVMSIDKIEKYQTKQLRFFIQICLMIMSMLKLLRNYVKKMIFANRGLCNLLWKLYNKR